MKKTVTIIGMFLVAFAAVAFFTGSLLGLTGRNLWILRVALWVLGAIAAVTVLLFLWQKAKREKAESAPAEEPAGTDDISLLIRDAESKLSAAQSGKGVKMGALPAVFLIGETGSAKTSTMLHSGLDAELLSGHVYQDNNVVSTRAANVWYAKRAVFLEGGGATVAEPGVWGKIAKRLQPSRLGSAVGSGGQSPRAALVMIEAESLIRPGATETLATAARTLRARLGEVSQALGISLPVYALFTKMDRVPFFLEYVGNLTNDEALQVVGVTLPIATDRTGVYAEQEAARLTGAFEDLFRSLANHRPTFLSREHDPVKLPGIYEFPREFRKLRATGTQFLVDLCRPSQLSAGPFLRGFYFSGVRPVVVNEVAPVPVRSQPKDREAALAATGMFRADLAAQAAAQAAPQVVGTKRVPQWVFLARFFNDLLLADRMAMGASGASTKTSLLRRILFGTAAALLFLYSIFLIVSFVKNRGLETTVKDAARGIQTVAPGGIKLASLDSLERLETLRKSLALLTDYTRNGTSPTSYHWGLYVGDDLYPHVRKVYFENFRRLLLGQTQGKLLDTMHTLPVTGPPPEYVPTYETLKAYLITTSNHDKSTREFLSPVLMNRWSAGQNVDADRVQLAQRQFDFYSEELAFENPFSSARDEAAVIQARKYLNQFAGLERVYVAMLGDAEKNSTPVNFNKAFPGSAETVLDAYVVPGAFTKKGWDFMRNAFKNPDRYFAGEEWVLGPQGAANIDKAALARQLSDRYNSDFIKQWRNYLRAGQVVRCKDTKDAAARLNVLSGNASTLLALFSLASTNTNVDEPAVKNAFQPVQSLVLPGAERFIGPGNQTYISALISLQSAVDKASTAPLPNDAALSAVSDEARTARNTTKQVTNTFNPDAEGHVDATVAKLMEDPITATESCCRSLAPDALNGKGKDLCAKYRPLMQKYPFNPDPKAPPASIAEMNSIFSKTDGAVWKFYQESLQKVLPKQGDDYVAAQTPGLTLTPSFVAFFNRVAKVSEMFYAGGTPDPHVTFGLKPLQAEGVKAIGLKLDGQSWTTTGGDTTVKQFTWQGTGAHSAIATVDRGGPLTWAEYDGLWATWQFFADAEEWQQAGSAWNLEWIVRTGRSGNPLKLESGKPLTVKFQLDMGGAPPVFQRGYLSKMVCIADVAR